MTFEKTGDWNIVVDVTNNLNNDLKKSSKETLFQVAQRAEKLAMAHLRKQDLPWKPLSERYKSWKAKTGLSTKTLIAKESYMKSIKSKVNPEGTIAFAGVAKGVINEDGMTIEKYAAIQEYGSVKRNIPARKLWGPVVAEVKEYMRKNNLFSKDGISKMRMRTGGKG